jgi:hypothetical protein
MRTDNLIFPFLLLKARASLYRHHYCLGGFSHEKENIICFLCRRSGTAVDIKVS